MRSLESRQLVSLFLKNLYDWWAEAEREEATGFDIRLFVNNKEFVGSLHGLTPQQAEDLIREKSRVNERAAPAAN